MTIGTPLPLGAGTGFAATTATLTTATNAAPVGSLIVVFARYTTVADTLSSVADSAGNSYTLLENITGTGIGIGIAYCAGSTVNLPVGGTITGTFAGATNSTITSGVVSNAASVPVDAHNKTSQGLAATTTGAIATGVLTQADEVIFSFTGTVSTGTPWTDDAAFTVLTGAISASHRVSYKVVSSTASVSATTTWSGANNYVCDLVSFKGSTATFVPYTSVYPALLAQ